MVRRRAWIAALIIVAASAALLLAMGRNPICTCGEIDLWVGTRDGPRTSQMIADWYSPSHLVHGFLFYAVLWLVARRWPPEWRFVLALLVEAAWEILENTPMVIDRYRQPDAQRLDAAVAHRQHRRVAGAAVIDGTIRPRDH
jgi:hypothetical protein